MSKAGSVEKWEPFAPDGIAQGGETLDEIKAPEGLGIFACALGGEDG
jgi:hypothetical protein